MWGCIGFGFFAIGVGYLIDVISKDSEKKNYSCMFYIMLVCMTLDILVSSRLKKVSIISIFFFLYNLRIVHL